MEIRGWIWKPLLSLQKWLWVEVKETGALFREGSGVSVHTAARGKDPDWQREQKSLDRTHGESWLHSCTEHILGTYLFLKPNYLFLIKNCLLTLSIIIASPLQWVGWERENGDKIIYTNSQESKMNFWKRGFNFVFMVFRTKQ